jgi:hypothetical protein
MAATRPRHHTPNHQFAKHLSGSRIARATREFARFELPLPEDVGTNICVCERHIPITAEYVFKSSCGNLSTEEYDNHPRRRPPSTL